MHTTGINFLDNKSTSFSVKFCSWSEEPYIDVLLKEWNLYCDLFDEKPQIKELHLGGGTPTFFSAENLAKLINGIMAKAEKCEEYEFSFEAHPNNTTSEHLQTLYDLGFRRNSFGVQDYDEKVQKTINRIQPFENDLGSKDQDQINAK